MLCGLCTNLAEYICSCSKFCICPEHLDKHTSIGKNHIIEALSITLDPFDEILFRKELKIRISELQNIKESVTIQTKVLIKDIELYNKQLLSKIENRIQDYLTFICLTKFSKSLSKEVDKIIETTFQIKLINFEIGSVLEDMYNSALIIEEKRIPENVLKNRIEEKIRRKERAEKEFKDSQKLNKKTKSVGDEAKEIYEAMRTAEIGKI